MIEQQAAQKIQAIQRQLRPIVTDKSLSNQDIAMHPLAGKHLAALQQFEKDFGITYAQYIRQGD